MRGRAARRQSDPRRSSPSAIRLRRSSTAPLPGDQTAADRRRGHDLRAHRAVTHAIRGLHPGSRRYFRCRAWPAEAVGVARGPARASRALRQLNGYGSALPFALDGLDLHRFPVCPSRPGLRLHGGRLDPPVINGTVLMPFATRSIGTWRPSCRPWPQPWPNFSCRISSTAAVPRRAASSRSWHEGVPPR